MIRKYWKVLLFAVMAIVATWAGIGAIMGQKKKEYEKEFNVNLEFEAQGVEMYKMDGNLCVSFKKEPPTTEDLMQLKTGGFEQQFSDGKPTNLWIKKKA